TTRLGDPAPSPTTAATKGSPARVATRCSSGRRGWPPITGPNLATDLGGRNPAQSTGGRVRRTVPGSGPASPRLCAGPMGRSVDFRESPLRGSYALTAGASCAGSAVLLY